VGTDVFAGDSRMGTVSEHYKPAEDAYTLWEIVSDKLPRRNVSSSLCFPFCSTQSRSIKSSVSTKLPSE
jgi:hypothetical protein